MGSSNVSQGPGEDRRGASGVYDTGDAADSRFERLEIKASDLEIMLAELHAALLSQDRELMALRGRLERAERRLAVLEREDDMPAPDTEIPPHY